MATQPMTIGDAIRARIAVRAFEDTPVPDETLAEVLRLMQRAPTGLNMQPYVCIVVRAQEERDALADAMLSTNSAKIKNAPVVVVFAADLEPGLAVPRIQDLKREYGVPESRVASMPEHVKLFSQYGLDPSEKSPLEQPTIAWSIKQTTYAAATLLYAAQEFGLGTCPMEGFDEARVRKVLEIPDRYTVPVVTTIGYPKEGAQFHTSNRLPSSEVIFESKFGGSSDKIFGQR